MDEIYLDNAATSWPKPEEVYRGIERFMRGCGGTPARGRHPRAVEAGVIQSECRRRLQELLGAGPGYRLVLTSGATESLNLAIKGWVKPGGHVVLTELEHNSVFRPLSTLARERGITTSVAVAEDDGTVDPRKVDELIRPDTCLVAVTHASNVLGVRVEVEEIAERAHRKGVAVLVDAAQTVGVRSPELSGSRIEMIAFTGHKSLLGGQGTGGLLLREDVVLRPLIEGGTGTFSEVPEQPEGFPDRYEAGSPNMYGIAGLLAGVAHLEGAAGKRIAEHKRQLVDWLRTELARLPGLRVYGSREPGRNVGILGFNVGGIPSEQVAELLWAQGKIMVRAGLHCAPRLHGRLSTRVQGVVRVGVGHANCVEDLERLIDVVRRLR